MSKHVDEPFEVAFFGVHVCVDPLVDALKLWVDDFLDDGVKFASDTPPDESPDCDYGKAYDRDDDSV